MSAPAPSPSVTPTVTLVPGSGIVIRKPAFLCVLGESSRVLLPDILAIETSVATPDRMPRRGRHVVRALAQLVATADLDQPADIGFAAPDSVGIAIYLSGSVFGEADGRRLQSGATGEPFDRAIPWPYEGLGLYLAGAVPAEPGEETYDLVEGHVPAAGALLHTPLGMRGTEVYDLSSRAGTADDHADHDHGDHDHGDHDHADTADHMHDDQMHADQMHEVGDRADDAMRSAPPRTAPPAPESEPAPAPESEPNPEPEPAPEFRSTPLMSKPPAPEPHAPEPPAPEPAAPEPRAFQSSALGADPEPTHPEPPHPPAPQQQAPQTPHQPWPATPPPAPTPPPPPAPPAPEPPIDFKVDSLQDVLPEQRDPLPVQVKQKSATEVVKLPESRAHVHGIRCSRGHLNHPRSWLCGVCGIRMDQLTGILVEGERPPLGWLLLDNGSTYLLDEDLVIGREPGTSGGRGRSNPKPIRVQDESGQLSRRHIELRLVEWDVHLIDLGSANGTFVSDPAMGTREIRLAPRQPHILSPGSHVRIGGRHFIFESPHART